jgi:tRNA-splicing ligase RtcB
MLISQRSPVSVNPNYHSFIIILIQTFMRNKISGKDLIALGFLQNNSINIALGYISRYKKKEKKESVLGQLKDVLTRPQSFIGDPVWGKIAESLVKPVIVTKHALRSERVPFTVFGENEIENEAKYQLYESLKLPVSVKGALMPDGHAGYGLPIGGVLATNNAVIPYGVGVDIGCRMSLSVFDLPADYSNGREDELKNMLIHHTKFGMSETHKVKSDHEVLNRKEFSEIPFLKGLLDKAYRQLGTSGGGNHFVEFGYVDIHQILPAWKIRPGSYFALLSHSGSRGLGANIARHFTTLAMKQCPLPRQVQHLAWLDLNTHDGMEYWMAMNLAGDYAAACHEDIHRRISKVLGTRPLLNISNSHNLAWKEFVDGRECIVHRKGATPAGQGIAGIIPGSMTAPGFIVAGKGNVDSIQSASHGAGRLFSRAQCKSSFTQHEITKKLKDAGVVLTGGSIDEAPMAYKDIQTVMALQTELVDVLGTFTPRIVRMDKS